MKPLTGAEIRKTWIEFFEARGHKWLPGVSLIPQGDKSLLWVNAGVTGLKKYFDGSEVPPCRRIVNVQKSIRTNDIENVGHTARHHTFFEMLGNFSIGDYFRKDAIAWAVRILTDPTEGFGMPLEKLYMTYNPSDGESWRCWQDNGVKADHLVPLESNFWQIGEGPCGPNTEVFYDRGEKWDPQRLGVKLLRDEVENDRYIELWGIVFSQFNAVSGVPRSQYKELPSKNIDTGAGLERIACILQGTPTNFETDLFMPIIRATERISGRKYEGPDLMSFRVIVDHARCLTFALSDGASFSNEGRGYVLRRIVRRAMRYGQKLGIREPFMHELVKVVADNYKGFYPELEGHVETVSRMVKGEEAKFLRTLSSGEEMLRGMLVGKKALSGAEAFRLYDTYGFPLDLTKEIAAEAGVSVDEAAFDEEMGAQRERARKARGEIESFHKQSKDLLAFKAPSEFLYGEDECEAVVTGLFVDGAAVNEISEEGEAAFDRTPFYAEMGGQAADRGRIGNKDFEAEVTMVGRAPSGQRLHAIQVRYGTLKVGDKVTLSIDRGARRLTERNHSATHLLHAALGRVLGEHVDQMGSYVDPDRLRFDFRFSRKLTKEELSALEKEVNEKIAEAIPERTDVLPIEEARKLGAEMEFAEKYGSTVRVVSFGDYSKEFCGGTHVTNSGDIGIFLITSEEAIASGVRRIEALTSLGAYRYARNRQALLEEGESRLVSTDVDFLPRLEAEGKELAQAKEDIESLKGRLAALDARKLAQSAERIGAFDFLYCLKEGASRSDLLRLADTLKAGRKDYVLVLLGGQTGRRPLVAMVGGEGLRKANAGDIVRTLAKNLGGGGGGRPEMASGQLVAREGLEAAVGALKESLK
jgi:alanyl-tRNA synthetase